MSITRETITWISVSYRLPDDDCTVLVKTPQCDEPVWLGWHDAEGWRSVDAAPYDEGDVVAWAAMPSGT